ncbi:MAG: M23 family metallopeptidase [Terriglobia bacterium]
MFMRRTGTLRATLALLALSACVLPAAGQGTPEEIPCGPGLGLRLSSVDPKQGALVLVEVRSAAPLTELRAGWAGQALQFWPQGNPGNRHRALVGVDLGREPRTYPLSLSAAFRSGARVACSALVTVREGGYRMERLRVARRFTRLSKKNAERARRESERLRAILGTVTPERLWNGGFRMPLAGVEGAGNFGRRRVLNDEPRSPHGGEDFPAPAGTAVHAAQRGRVVLAEDLFFSGNTVVLDHGLGLFTYYAHLQSVAVKPGQLVEAGAVVGRVGATGRVTGAHLHWAARLHRARVNPLDLVTLLSE